MRKLMIFDVDGVLGDFTQLKLLRDQAHIEAIARKHQITMNQARILFYNTKEKNKAVGKAATMYTMLSLGITKEEFYAVMNSVPIEGNIVPTKDVQQVIKTLALNNILVALTNTPYDATIKTLNYLEVLPCFKKVYTPDRYNYIKPSTEIFKQILSEHNFQPHLSISIGDSIEKDLKPAKNIGIKTVLFSQKLQATVDDAYYTICELNQLLPITESLKEQNQR